MNVLVAYFSASGVTEKVAKKLADVTAEWIGMEGRPFLFHFRRNRKGRPHVPGGQSVKRKAGIFRLFRFLWVSSGSGSF